MTPTPRTDAAQRQVNESEEGPAADVVFLCEHARALELESNRRRALLDEARIEMVAAGLGSDALMARLRAEINSAAVDKARGS